MVAVNTIAAYITASISYKVHDYVDRIKFANTIIVDKERTKVEKHLHYKLKQCKRRVAFDIMNDISEHITLMQLMD